jgi:glutamate dehydrogenase
MKSILLAPVDLFWNGGIGTYIKAETESDADVGDRANDSIRVNGNQLRAKVVGEGGNLGVTQRGRIEFDLAGGHINTDAMDNSAGVDCSDHEVNIKILVDALVTAGKVAAAERTDLLMSMTDEVGRLVLADNMSQNDLMGTSRANAASLLPVHAAQIRDLAANRGLNRELEALPSEKEIRRRMETGLGLTSPELATLMAHVKLALKEDVLASELPDQEVFAGRLPDYFPEELRDRFAADIRSHQLRREIITTMLVNDLVDTAGITYAYRVAEDVGVGPVDAVRSYVAVGRRGVAEHPGGRPGRCAGGCHRPDDAGPAPADRPRGPLAAELPAPAAGGRRRGEPVRGEGGRAHPADGAVAAWR